MRKICFFIIGAVILATTGSARGAYEYTLRITPKHVVDFQNNFLFDHEGLTYLIHHKAGCGEIVEGSSLTLIVRGEIDGGAEELWNGSRICVVDQAEQINGIMTVDDITTAETYSVVTNESGQGYRIYYSSMCSAIKNMAGRDVYFYHYGYQLQEGDVMFLPNNEAYCVIDFVQPLEEEAEFNFEPTPVSETGVYDAKRPSTPEHFRAIPTTSAVYLYWDPAVDDVGISHYLISPSLYHIENEATVDEENLPVALPNLISTGENVTSLRIDNLESDELYFFRVIAVDGSGHWSSRWSYEASAMTRSSILENAHEIVPVEAKILQETDRYFHVEWSEPSVVKRRQVELRANNELIYYNSNWLYNKIRPLKLAERKGKNLELVIRVYDFRGIMQEDRVQFSF